MCLIFRPEQGLNPADLRCTVTGGFSSFSYAQFLDLSVIQNFLMSFLIGLFAPVNRHG